MASGYSPAMIKPIRRVVTGHDARGRSIFVSDGPSPHVLTIPGRPDFALTNLWVTDGAPASNAGSADAADRPVVLEPPRNGAIFRVVEFPPDRAPGGSGSPSPPPPSCSGWSRSRATWPRGS